MDQRNKQWQSMDVLGEDELWLILNRVCHPNDRKSVSLVCKQWRKQEALTRSSITIFDQSLCTTNILSSLLHRLLPRYPNLVTFETSMCMRNNDLKFVAQACPNLETLTLLIHPCEKIAEGMRALATYCPKLSRVKLRGGSENVEVEVLSFLTSSHINLTHLDLTDCGTWVTDRTLEAIAPSNCFKTIKALILGRRHKISDSGFSHLQNMGALEELDLKGSRDITDRALEFLARGSVSKTMKKLVLARCKKITDSGVSFLQNMCTLEELNLEYCRKVTQRGLEFLPKTMKIFSCTFEITEVGLSHLRDFYVLEKLELRGWSPNIEYSGLECLVNASCLKTFTCNIKVTDAGLSLLGKKCLLEELELRNGGLITDCGLRSLANALCSKTMKKLAIKGCHGITNCGMWYLRKMRVLEELNIDGCTDCELDFLSKTMKKLTCGFEITDLGLYNLGKNICLLEELVLEESSLITDFGLECLTSASCSKTLKKLYISKCHKITDSGMKLLQKMRVLEYVTMTGRWRNNVTEQGFRAIEAIPTLRQPPTFHKLQHF